MTQVRMIALLMLSLSPLAGCGPFVIHQQVVAATGMSFAFTAAQPGQAIPAQLSYLEFAFPVAWPSIQSLQEDVRKISNSLEGTPITLKGVQPNRFVVMATTGDFGSFEDVGISVTLPNGTVMNTKGEIGDDKTRLVLTVQDKVNLLEEVQQLESTDTNVKVRLSAHGLMPDPNPVFDVAVQGYVSASVLFPGLIVEAPVNIPVATGQTIAQIPPAKPGDPISPQLADVGYGIDVAWPTVKTFEKDTFRSAGLGFIGDYLQIDSLIPENLELVCTTGDFSSLDKVGLVLTLPDGTEIDAEGQIGDDKKSMVIVTDSAVDLMALFRKFGGATKSITFKVKAEGTVPASDTVFDVKLNITATISVYIKT